MRFIHTSDWHIGRLLHERSLLEDQEYILQSFVRLVKESEVELVVIAGDIFDRPVPSKEGIRLLDSVMTEIVLGLKVPVFMISGNHDSAERLGFGSRLLSSTRLRIVSTVESMLEPLLMHDRHGPIEFYGIPYFDPPTIRLAAQNEKLPDEPKIQDHASAMKWCVDQILNHSSIRRSSLDQQTCVAVAHAYVAGSSLRESESERPLSIGGSFAVDSSLFKHFHYTALGHLHRAQAAGSSGIRYSGSILPYGFDEAQGTKSISIVELGESRVPTIETVPMSPLRRLRSLRGEFSQLLKTAESDPDSNDYIEILLDDEIPIVDPMGKLRRLYPNLLHLQKIRKSASSRAEFIQKELNVSTEAEKKALNPGLIFQKFFLEVAGRELSASEESILQECLGASVETSIEANVGTSLGTSLRISSSATVEERTQKKVGVHL